MNIQAVHVIVHTPEQVRGIVSDARDIANETDATGSEWEAIFRESCRLLGQRYTVVSTPEPVDLSKLRGF